MPFKTIQIQSKQQRLLLIAGAFLCAVAAIMVFKWTFGHAVSIRAEQKEVADLSASLAPGDPQTHFAAAVLHEKDFSPEDIATAVTEYEKAASLSPNDYRLWLALGKARERSGDLNGAENALRRAVELAPNYGETHWTLGNNLLRQGKSDEAFTHIRSAAIFNELYVIPAISTAWQIFGGDIAKVRQNIGDSPRLNAFLAVYLLQQERYDESFETWNILPTAMKSGLFMPQSEQLLNRMIDVGKYRYARQIKSVLDGNEMNESFGKFTYGGFENNTKTKTNDYFNWKIADGAQPLIGFDDKIKHGGNLSLVVIFNSPNGSDFRQLSQTIAVEAGKSYSFEGFYKSELKTTASIYWSILNASDRSVIASTETVAVNSDWTKFGVGFTVPANAEAVIVNLERARCGSTICPITGKVWFDDFVLTEK